jgi:hypothetical protein
MGNDGIKLWLEKSSQETNVHVVMNILCLQGMILAGLDQIQSFDSG